MKHPESDRENPHISRFLKLAWQNQFVDRLDDQASVKPDPVLV